MFDISFRYDIQRTIEKKVQKYNKARNNMHDFLAAQYYNQLLGMQELLQGVGIILQLNNSKDFVLTYIITFPDTND